MLACCGCFFLFTGFPSAQLPSSYWNQGIDALIHDIQDQKVMRWQMVREEDPFRRGAANPYGQEPVYLALSANGRYRMKKGESVHVGTFTAIPETATLIFRCQVLDGRPLPEPVERTYLLETYASGKLVLKWQGRHGWIRQHFMLYERSAVLALSL